jgi:uncharacterized BrkB/YihY/UPF0761 family membrane protein
MNELSDLVRDNPLSEVRNTIWQVRLPEEEYPERSFLLLLCVCLLGVLAFGILLGVVVGELFFK